MAVSGLDKLKAKIASISIFAKLELAKELDRSADDIVSVAKSFVPVDHGDLRASIRKETGKHELSRKVIAGDANAPYARFVEFGHSDAKPRPFFFPAYRALRRSIVNRMGRAYRKAAASSAESASDES